MTWRRLRAGELDHEALWLSVFAAAACIGVAWLQLALPRPVCAFHHVTGWACPGCGTTRCLEYLLRGAFGDALRVNPLAFLGFGAAVLYVVYAAVVLLLNLPRLRFDVLPARTGDLVRAAVVGVIAVNWLWLLVTGV